jgi:hypothetical protein
MIKPAIEMPIKHDYRPIFAGFTLNGLTKKLISFNIAPRPKRL